MRRLTTPIRASTAVKSGGFHCYSNTSDDALGLSGAFADIGSALSQAKKAILITSWLFNPSLHLPFFHEQLRTALQWHEKNNFSDAVIKYREVIATFSDTSIENQYAHYFLCIAALQQNDSVESDKLLQICLSKAPHNLQFQNTELCLLLLQNKLNEAKAKAKVMARLPSEKTDARFWSLYGDIAFALGDADGAETHYKHALEKYDVQCLAARIGLGRVLLQKNEVAAAEESFSSVLNYFPNDFVANYYLAKIRLAQNRVDEAMQHALRVSDVDRENTVLQIVYVTAFFQKHRASNPEACVQLLHHALKKDQANFSLMYGGALLFLEKNDIENAKEILSKCMQIDPEKVKIVLEKDAAKWADVDLSALNLESKISLFRRTVPVDSSTEEKIEVYKKLIEAFPYCRDFYFNLAECSVLQGDLSEALTQFCRGADLTPFDLSCLKKVIQKISMLALSSEEDKQYCTESIVLYQKNINRLQNHFDFYTAYAGFREQLPTLGELLVKKAHENPNMVVALQIWNRSQLHDRHYVSELQKEFERIAQKMGLDKIPDNVLLRFTNTEGVAYTHHQKYIVVDTGNVYPIVFYGSCDLACGKFDWSEHPLVNTEENNGAVTRAHGFNQAENMNSVNGSKLKLPWREVLSCAEGPIAVDFVAVFEDRWRALGHGTFRGMKGAKNQNLVTVYAVELQSRAVPEVVDEQSWLRLDDMAAAISDANDENLYPWQAQLLQSTKQSYAPTNVGFFKATDRAVESSVQDAMIAAIAAAENYIYIETQYFTDSEIANALVLRIQDKHMRNESFHVYMVLPFSPNGDPGGKFFVEPVRIAQWELMQRCMQSVEDRTQKPWNTYLSFLFFAQWEGVSYELKRLHTDGRAHGRGELLNASYRQPVYIHSKLMVVDDKKIINGSANLNERSLSGEGDTEIAVIQMPKPGCELRCQRIVRDFMRERILLPYFGESTVAALLAEPKQSLQKNNTIFTNKTVIKDGRITTKNIVLQDYQEFTYRLFLKEKIVATLDTTPQKLWNAFVELARHFNFVGKDKKCFDALISALQTTTQKLLKLIEYVRKNANGALSNCYQLTFYQCYKAQLCAQKNTEQFSAMNVEGLLQTLSNYFNLSEQNKERSNFLSQQYASERVLTEPRKVMPAVSHFHLGSPEVVRHIQQIARENYDAYASNEMGHRCGAEKGKVVLFPLRTDECGQVGQLRQGCEMIPDAPIDATGKASAVWCWVPSANSLVLGVSTMVGYKGVR